MRLTADANGAAGTRLMAGAAACVLALAGVVGGTGTALAQSTPEPTPESQLNVPEAVPGEEVCAVADPRLTELSGLAARGDGGYIAVNDGQDFDDTRRPIFFLDADCNVVDEQSFFPGQPRDPEGMELSGDGSTLWIGDTGDNAAGGTGEGDTRLNVALWRVDLSGGDRTPLVHRFNYPDNQARDAEALLLDGDGTPIIVTKELGAAGLYVPTEVVPSQSPDQFVPLEQVGEFSPPDTGTDNPFQSAGRQVITGGAVSPDGSRVVLRTYADAFEFDVTDGDVVGAITSGEPRVTPLPDEPQGESITYSADGEQFLTVSEVLDQNLPEATILAYTPTAPAPDPPPSQAAGGTETSDSGGGSLFNSVQDIINVIAGVGVVGLLLVAAGVFGIVRARRRAASGGDDGAEEPDDGPPSGLPTQGRARPSAGAEPGWEPDPASRVQAAAGVYTSTRAVADAEPAAGYGAGPAYPEGEYRGTEYGAGGYGGAEYAAGTEYGGTTYGGAEYSGATYNGEYAGGDYAAQPHGDYRGGNHHGGEYRGGDYQGGEYRSEYGAGGHDQPYDQAWAEGDGSRGGYADPYQGNGGPPAQPAPDYYSDDPDYPYEFRGRDRW